MKTKGIFLALGLTAAFLLTGGCGGGAVSSGGGTGTEAQTETMQEKALHDDSVSVEYINALIKGIQYAKDMHMSKQRVYDQLSSDYGEQFSQDAAAWAVAHMSDIDWKANALVKAKFYRDDMHLSNNRIYQQLTSDYGERFAKDETDYAMAHIDDAE